jgi:hypothetical protein
MALVYRALAGQRIGAWRGGLCDQVGDLSPKAGVVLEYFWTNTTHTAGRETGFKLHSVSATVAICN